MHQFFSLPVALLATCALAAPAPKQKQDTSAGHFAAAIHPHKHRKPLVEMKHVFGKYDWTFDVSKFDVDIPELDVSKLASGKGFAGKEKTQTHPASAPREASLLSHSKLPDLLDSIGDHISDTISNILDGIDNAGQKTTLTKVAKPTTSKGKKLKSTAAPVTSSVEATSAPVTSSIEATSSAYSAPAYESDPAPVDTSSVVASAAPIETYSAEPVEQSSAAPVTSAPAETSSEAPIVSSYAEISTSSVGTDTSSYAVESTTSAVPEVSSVVPVVPSSAPIVVSSVIPTTSSAAPESSSAPAVVSSAAPETSSAATSSSSSVVVVASSTKSTTGGKVTAVAEQNESSYLSPVSIGGQTLTMNFDTGSADLWVFSSSLTEAQRGNHTVYDSSQSSTWQTSQGSTWSIAYGDGSSASGTVGFDTVVVGGATATSQAVELATAVSTKFSSDYNNDGLVGLAWSSINTIKPTQQKTFFENIMSNLDQPLFTADLRQDTEVSTYEFGVIDAAKYKGDIHYTPIDNSQGLWQFASTTYTINGQSFTNANAAPAIADTGTSLILADQATVTAYYGAVTGSKLDTSVGGYTYPCTATLPEFGVQIGSSGYTAVIPGSGMTYASLGNGYCFGGLQSNGGGSYQILGDMLFKQYLAIFNGGEKKFGLALKA